MTLLASASEYNDWVLRKRVAIERSRLEVLPSRCLRTRRDMHLPIPPVVLLQLTLGATLVIVLRMGNILRQQPGPLTSSLIPKKLMRGLDILLDCFLDIDGGSSSPAEKQRLNERCIRDRRMGCAHYQASAKAKWLVDGGKGRSVQEVMNQARLPRSRTP